MLIYGHRFIKSEVFYHIQDIDSISHTPANSTLYVDFDEKNLEIIRHAVSNQLSLATGVKNITQLIYASALGASFILVDKNLVKTAQDIANNYLFDAKILAHIDSEDEIEEFAILNVDGVIFSNAIVKISS